MFLLIKKIWLKFAHTLGRINTFILLCVFYFLVIGIVSIFYQVSHLGKRKKITTNWKQKTNWKPDLDWMLKLY